MSKALNKELRKQQTREAMAKRANRKGSVENQNNFDFYPYENSEQESWTTDDNSQDDQYDFSNTY